LKEREAYLSVPIALAGNKRNFAYFIPLKAATGIAIAIHVANTTATK
jgi:hypothetical protein